MLLKQFLPKKSEIRRTTEQFLLSGSTFKISIGEGKVYGFYDFFLFPLQLCFTFYFLVGVHNGIIPKFPTVFIFICDRSFYSVFTQMTAECLSSC